MDQNSRTVLRLSGADAASFLQNIVTNDVDGLKDGIVWTALLTPQGKYLADFFLVPDGDDILLDVASDLAPALGQRLSMYKLRANVSIEQTNICPSRGIGLASDGAFQDPRDETLGWRAYDGRAGEDADWTALRVAAGVPETGVELIPNETYPLEVGFDRLNGVDFRKGCYVGQEVTARMRHKTTLKKGLKRISISAPVSVGTEVTNSEGRSVGVIYSQANGEGLAYLRFDRVTKDMTADGSSVQVIEEV